MIVQKYGGSSVATPEKIKAVASKVKKKVDEGKRVVVVVSAMGKTTNSLIDLAKEVTPNPPPREMDMLLATGEQVTAALLAMALSSEGINALSMNAFQLELMTSDHYTNARIMDLNLAKLQKELAARKVVVVTGFQGITEAGDVTTLGRGGSDTSAVAIAAKLGVPCEIYSDVVGIYTCDPKLHPTAKKLAYITYDEILEMAALGAKVLHSRSVEIAKKYGVELYCASTFSEERGTYVVNALPEWLEQPVVTGATIDANQIKVTLNNISSDVEVISGVFNSVAERGLNVDMISIVNVNGHGHITFTVIGGNIQILRNAIEKALTGFSGWGIHEDVDVAKVSVVGLGMSARSGVAARFFNVMREAKVKIIATTTSEIKISALVHKSDSGKALKALIDEFKL
ncbi:MAG: aspartate kinase [Candidatus Riflebacteria bacterium]|nr:aspartate kinase [Candidatus Riflebacteria bacterium]